MDQLITDDLDYAERSEYWHRKSILTPTHPGPAKRRERRPLIICGHGARLNIERGTLFVKNGFTHYPQKQEEFRYFRGDPHLPNRIIIMDASGSISFDVLAWLDEQKIPLIHLNWQGDIICVANANYSADPKLVGAQRKALETGHAANQSRQLIIEKFKNSISTLKLLPDNSTKSAAIELLNSAISELNSAKIIPSDKMLGMEGQVAALYFGAWRGIPIKWKLSKKEFIPNDWNVIGGRRSAISKTNRNARHPVNAMLNYGYAILHAQIKMQIIAEGLDPTIGLSHSVRKYRDALVLDRMEPLRPLIDLQIIKFVLENTFRMADFTVTTDGFCRLNPELARKIISIIESPQISYKSKYLEKSVSVGSKWIILSIMFLGMMFQKKILGAMTNWGMRHLLSEFAELF